MSEVDVNYGEVFTRRWVVDSILDLCQYTPDRNLTESVVVEPSVGTGAFFGPIVERLLASAKAQNVPIDSLDGALRGFDVQDGHVDVCRKEARRLLEQAGCGSNVAERIATAWVRSCDFLLDDEQIEADLVVGNPPYIRSDELDERTEATYRHLWRTMKGRADIYVAFYERSLSLLKPGGKVGFICADRWMRNQYGANLREHVSKYFAVEAIWQMHDVDAFEADVSAYPAITILGAHRQGSVVIADTTASFSASQAADLVEFTLGPKASKTDPTFEASRIDGWFEGRDLWPSTSPEKIAILERLNEEFSPLEDTATATKVGIGVATGADKAYIQPRDVDVEQDRKLPIAMTADIRSGEFVWGENVLLNPWDDQGQLVDLDQYPRLRAALEQSPTIKDRYVAKKAPHAWHRTIDRVNPALTGKPKLLIQDMKATIQPVYEPGGHYPHHNLYVVTSDTWDLHILGGILLSRVAQLFIEAYGVKMRGGTLRFQSQYLRTIRVPSPDAISAETARALAEAFESRDADAATRAAEAAYGMPAGTL